jgi:hypothetical protein
MNDLLTVILYLIFFFFLIYLFLLNLCVLARLFVCLDVFGSFLIRVCLDLDLDNESCVEFTGPCFD